MNEMAARLYMSNADRYPGSLIYKNLSKVSFIFCNIDYILLIIVCVYLCVSVLVCMHSFMHLCVH